MLSAVGVQLVDRRYVVLVGSFSALVAAGLGLAAVLSPAVAVAAAGAALFAAVAFRNLTAGLAFFVLLSFFDRATALTG